MILYDNNGNKINFKTNEIIGNSTHGNVYKVSEIECIKIYKNGKSVNYEILNYIKQLKLKNYYEIHNFYNNKNGIFKAITMKYYKKEDIDILTMPIEYTLDNLFKIQSSIDILTQNRILVEDTHTGNIIMDNNSITIIDVDLYNFSNFYIGKALENKNNQRLAYLFREIFIEAISNYHNEYNNTKTAELIQDTFKLLTQNQTEKAYTILSKYKYPIDYIKKKVKYK